MYSSLTRIDSVLEVDGDHRFYVQTDHRTTAEIEQEPELSVFFTLTRILMPRRLVEDENSRWTVLHMSPEPPPEFLQRVIHAAGGVMGTTDNPQTEPWTFEGEPDDLDQVIQSALANLAKAVADEFEVPLTIEGLEILENALGQIAGNPEEDEIAYWSAVAKLGSFAGEVVRASLGGQWFILDSGTLPFALSTHYADRKVFANIFDKAIKLFDELFDKGEGTSLAAWVAMICKPNLKLPQ